MSRAQTIALVAAAALLSGCEPVKGGIALTGPCVDAPGDQICQDDILLTCDAEGVISGTEDCAASGSACVEGAACVPCQPAVTFELADADAVAASGVGLRTVPRDAADADFSARRLFMRPLTVSADAALGGQLVLDADSDDFALYTASGDALDLPATLDVADLPATLYLAALKPATGALMATWGDGPGCATEVSLRAGRLPGLAGRARANWPGFEVVDVFWDSEPVSVALDPSWHPDRVGLSADVYVVAHRSLDDWAADPTLTDLTGEVETITVADGALADALTEVWADGPDAGGGLGAAYDVVIDFGQDGQLDPGDVLDGGAAASFTALGDPSLPGPHEVSSADYSGGVWLGQRLYWPTDLADRDPAPVVIISHGNGHRYDWYDYLGEHLASWGYVVMSHQNNTGPGIETASTTTLANTDYLMGHLDTIADGVLDGHVATDRVLWIGHSRGGEGVVRAYDRLATDDYAPEAYSIDDIAAVASIAPTVYFSVDVSNPHDVPYLLLAGAADGDVTGGANCEQCQFFRISSAARGDVAVQYVQGASHNDFNCCGFDDGTGPDLIGRDAAQVLAKSVFLAWVELYGRDNAAMKDLFSRPYATFHAPAVDPAVVVASTWRGDPEAGDRILDDYQAGEDAGLSSAGDVVETTLTTVVEDSLDDPDTKFSEDEDQPMNGMTQAEDSQDEARGVTMQWDEGEDHAYGWALEPERQDWSAYTWLSLRAAQSTRDARTVALDGPLSFSVELEDTNGVTSAIDFGDLAWVTRPYQRGTLGGGRGWANEFNTVRLRLTDFAADGTGLDLRQIATVRLRFGDGWGSAQGRVGLDDITLVVE